jgi:hypothetical protein
VKKFKLELYTATHDRKIAHVQLFTELRGGREYLYLQFKDRKRPTKIYVAKLAGECCNRRRR